MWTWIYYAVITFGALALCSTFAIIQIMSSENLNKDKEEAPATNTIDIESGQSLIKHRKIKIKPNDRGVLNF